MTVTDSERRPRLLEEVRRAMRVKRYSPRTQEAYLRWIRRYIDFHGRRHPAELGEEEIARFLTHLTDRRRVSASTQSQAASALMFLYKRVLRVRYVWAGWRGATRAKVPRRLPVVLARQEVRAVFRELSGRYRLVAMLLYGSGLRLQECLQLRVKDLDFHRGEIRVRRGKGGKDRVTMLPASAREPLGAHLRQVEAQHRRDLRRGGGYVELPDALEVKYPAAAREWAWQFVFPATRSIVDRRTGRRLRHHLHPTAVQRAVRQAVLQAGLTKSASCHRRCRSCWAIGTPAVDDDLHARVEPGWTRGAQPDGRDVGGLCSYASINCTVLMQFPFLWRDSQLSTGSIFCWRILQFRRNLRVVDQCRHFG